MNRNLKLQYLFEIEKYFVNYKCLYCVQCLSQTFEWYWLVDSLITLNSLSAKKYNSLVGSSVLAVCSIHLELICSQSQVCRLLFHWLWTWYIQSDFIVLNLQVVNGCLNTSIQAVNTLLSVETKAWSWYLALTACWLVWVCEFTVTFRTTPSAVTSTCLIIAPVIC